MGLKEPKMTTHLTLEYWLDDGWYVGRMKEIPGVFSQGADLTELEENIIEAYRLVLSESSAVEIPQGSKTKELAVTI
jgi:predicted RNase H-like HicB family nuclease